MPSRYYVRYKGSWNWLTLYGPFNTESEAVDHSDKERFNLPPRTYLALFLGRRMLRELDGPGHGVLPNPPKSERVTTVVLGEPVVVVNKHLMRAKAKEGPTGVVYDQAVQAACDDKANGKWYCTTHMEIFYNQLEKDAHIHDGEHRLAWLCFTHGPEVP